MVQCRFPLLQFNINLYYSYSKSIVPFLFFMRVAKIRVAFTKKFCGLIPIFNAVVIGIERDFILTQPVSRITLYQLNS